MIRVGILIWVLILTISGAPAEQTFYKGNTHAHSLWSDGNDFLEMVVDYYHRHDYDFVAVSDHDILARDRRWMAESAIHARQTGSGPSAIEKCVARFGPDWITWETVGGKTGVVLKTLAEVRAQFESPGEFLILEAQEISDQSNTGPVHINALNLARLVPTKDDTTRPAVEVMRELLQAVIAQEKTTGRPILTHLNHPNFQWAITAEDLATVTEERFFEVYNGHPSINHLGDETRPGNEVIWDIANTLRLTKLDSDPLFGVATDDSHHYHGGNVSPGRGWIQVAATELTPEALITAMRAGDFYASTGVELHHFSYDPETRILDFSIKSDGDTRFRSELIGTRRGYDKVDGTARIGEVFAFSSDRHVRFSVPVDALYARVTITATSPHPNPSFDFQTKQAWLQPVGWR